jgi:alpha-N-arabinofuranosidase
VWRDDFSSEKLAANWNILGTMETPWYKINPNNKNITINALESRLSGLAQPAFIGRRQQHTHFDANTELQLPTEDRISAGIAVFQSEASHYYFAIQRKNNSYQLTVEQTNKKAPTIIASSTINSGDAGKTIVLGIEGDAGKVNFYYKNKTGKRINILKEADAKMLSTENAGGFVGTYIGMHARTEP